LRLGKDDLAFTIGRTCHQRPDWRRVKRALSFHGQPVQQHKANIVAGLAILTTRVTQADNQKFSGIFNSVATKGKYQE